MLSLFALRFVPGMLVDSEIHIDAGCILEHEPPIQGLVHEARRQR